MVNKITKCSDDTAVSLSDYSFKVSQLKEKLMEQAFSDNNLGYLVYQQIKMSGIDGSNYNNWFGDGLDAEILVPGAKVWQKGKMRLKVNVEVEFISDEPETTKPESPLDDLRQKL
ncbi:MAG: KGK domain-containing protein [Hormoscilla sp.]